MYHAISEAARLEGDGLGGDPEVRGEGPGGWCGAAVGGRWSVVFDPAPDAAELAARLARAVGPAAVVCLGCALAVAGTGSSERELITLSRPPLERVRIEPGRLLLVVSLGGTSFDLESCATTGVPEVWLFESREGLLSCLSHPRQGCYRRRSLILPGERRRLAALPAVEFTPWPAG